MLIFSNIRWINVNNQQEISISNLNFAVNFKKSLVKTSEVIQVVYCSNVFNKIFLDAFRFFGFFIITGCNFPVTFILQVNIINIIFIFNFLICLPK